MISTGIIIASNNLQEDKCSMGSLDVLAKNRALFLKMKELVAKQEKLASDDEMDKFFDLNSQRERLMRKISANNQRLGIGNGLDRGEEAKALSMEINDVIESIQEMDRRVEEFINEEKGKLLSDIKRMRKGQKAVKGYVRKSPKSPKFISRKG